MPKLLSDLQKATMLGSPLRHDVQWVGAQNKDLCLSWSKLEKFNQCPRQFKYIYIDKAVPFDDSNPVLQWGKKVHKGLEDYLLKGIQLPTELKRFQAPADAIKNQAMRLDADGRLQTPLNGEQEWAMTANGKYTTWFNSKEVFMRNKADAIWGSKKVLFSVDWKTGAGKYPKVEQLEVVALVGKAQPKLAKYDVHKSALVFLEADKIVPLNIDVSPTGHEALMGKYLKQGIDIVEAYEECEWAMNPTVLCGWCDDKSCPYNTKE